MSNLCGINFYNVDRLSNNIKQDLIDMLKKEGVFTNYLTELSEVVDSNDPEDYIGFEDDPTGVIYDWIKRYKLTISYDFIGEDNFLSDSVEFIDGIEQE